MTNVSPRKVNESPQWIGLDETIPFVFDLSGWSTAGTAAAGVVFDVSAGGSVAGAVSGTPSVSNGSVTVIVCGTVLSAGHEYICRASMEVAGRVRSAYVDIKTEY